ncbi:hypothetical protein GCM10027406_13560 [Leifsonia lichenia]
MSDARDTAPETPSGEPHETAPDDTDPETEEGKLLDGREPYDADGVVEPRGSAGDDDAGTDDIAAEPLDDDQL